MVPTGDILSLGDDDEIKHHMIINIIYAYTICLGDDDEIKHHMMINIIYAYTICSYVCVILWVSVCVCVNAKPLENAASLIVVSYVVLHRDKFNEIPDWG